jgi:hypothetical protein
MQLEELFGQLTVSPYVRPYHISAYRCGTFFRIQDGSMPTSLEILFYLAPISRKKSISRDENDSCLEQKQTSGHVI